LTELVNHLWQSTFLTALAAGACFGLRKNRARLRYWLWLAASVKFLIPFSVLIGLGSVLAPPASTPIVSGIRAVQVQKIETIFAPLPVRRPVPAPSRLLPFLWGGGALLVTASWMRRWIELRRMYCASRPAPIDFVIPVALSPAAIEPGVFGFFRPVLLLPQDLGENLDPDQFGAVLAHERCHIDARDHLTSAVHLVVCTLFWFHPAVWYIGRCLIEERERACDEAVLRGGKRPETYAQSILNVCRHYREFPLDCAPAVTGADLKRRIREIMSGHRAFGLTRTRKALLAAATVAAIAVPITIGILHAQTLPPSPAYGYEVVSIKPSSPSQGGSQFSPGPQGGLRIQNFTVLQMLTFAYDARTYQFVDVPGWANSEHFDVEFTADKPDAAPSHPMSVHEMEAQLGRQRQRLQAVLRDRFGLVLKAETREFPIYMLTVAKGGSKLLPTKTPDRSSVAAGASHFVATAEPVSALRNFLSAILGRFVRDETGLTGEYDFEVRWTPDPTQTYRGTEPVNADDSHAVSIFTALQEQLGLKLEATRGQVPVFVVEKITKPNAN
jgi:bla regulator protein blaR1